MAKNGEPKRFLLEPHSLCYLDPTDGLGALITVEVFEGKNYDLWEKAI